MKVRCPYCQGTATFPIPNFIIEDGEIIWGECDECGKEVAIDCIVTINPN